MTNLKIFPWGQKDIELYWNSLMGSQVVYTPHLGEDLVVWVEKGQFLWVNLGRIERVGRESGSGREFLVRTDRFGDRDEIFVQLADGVRATVGNSMEDVENVRA